MSREDDVIRAPWTPLKVFISYAREDRSAATLIENCLTACGADVWLDEQRIAVGDSIPLRISQGLSESECVILLMSEISMSSSWVQREWLPSLMREIDTGKMRLLPARLDDCDIPVIISDKYYADFRTSFLKGLSDLVNALKDRILEKQGSLSTTDWRGRSWTDFVVRITNEVQRDESIEVAFLLNTLVYSNIGALVDPDGVKLVRTNPKWLHGNWKSVKGWNAGYVFTCDDGHECGSVGGYATAVGSFSGSLRNGIIRWVKDVGDRLLLFRWYQETSGSMGGVVGDTGFGVWRVGRNSETLRGIWWYEPVLSRVRHAELTRRAYVWELNRIHRQEESDSTFTEPANLTENGE